jgi:hypothetical protein
MALIMAVRHRSPGWGYVAACCLLLLVLGVQHRRFSTYSACAGAAMVPIALTMITRRYDRRSPVLAAAARIALVLGLILGPLVVHRAIAGAAGAAAPTGACNLQAAAPMLAPFAGQVMLADVNDSPELLYRTGVLTVGSLYIRNPDAFMRLRAAWRSDAGGPVPPPAVRETGASLVLFCRRAGRSPMVEDLPRETLWDRLSRDETPAWLRKVGESAGSGYVLYSILG